MALDIHRLDNDDYIFGLNDEWYNCLDVIFKRYESSTGIYIDPYKDTVLDIGNMKFLIKLINEYIQKTDLNENKKQTSIILEFKGMLSLFIEKGIALKLYGD